MPALLAVLIALLLRGGIAEGYMIGTDQTGSITVQLCSGRTMVMPMPGHPGGDHDGEHLPDCCLLLCASASPTVADAPAPMVWPPIVRADKTIAPATSQVAARQNRRTPANPRAPPAAA